MTLASDVARFPLIRDVIDENSPIRPEMTA